MIGGKIKKAILIICSIISLGSMLVGCQSQAESSKEMTEKILKYGDDFSKISLQDVGGKECRLESNDKYRLVFIFSSLCGSCKKQLEVIHRFQQFYKPYVDVAIIWEDKVVDKTLLKENAIPYDANYKLGLKKISTMTPTAVIVGKDNKALFVTTEMDNIAPKLNELEGISIEVVQKNVCMYLQNDNKTGKDVLVYFAMEGCQDCEETDKIIDQDIKKKYDVKKIYDSNAYGSEQNVDLDNIYLSIYGLDWYPSFLIIRGDTQKLVGEIPINNLKEELMKGLE